MERIDHEGHQLPRKGQNILSASPPPLSVQHQALYKAALEKRGRRGTDANERVANWGEKW